MVGHHKCTSTKLHHGPNGVRDELCFDCYLRDHEVEEEAEPAKKSQPCTHLGGDTGERTECRSCAGTVRIKIMTCAVHGRCTVAKQLGDGTACCKACADYRPLGSVV